MTKRMISVLLAGMLLLLLISGATVSARAQTTDFTLSVTEGKVGDTVTVSIHLSEQSYFTNSTFYLHYDPAVVAYVFESEDVGAISPKNTMFAVKDHANKGYIKGVYVTVNGISAGGVLMTIDFTVLSDEPAVFSLTFDECCGADENGAEFDVSYQTIGCVLNNRTTPDTSVTAPTIAAPTTAPNGDSHTTAPDGTITTTLPADISGGSVPPADATTTPNQNNEQGGSTTAQDETSTTTTRMLTPIDEDETDDPDPASDVGAIVAIVAVVILLAGGVTTIAVIAAKKAKKS